MSFEGVGKSQNNNPVQKDRTVKIEILNDLGGLTPVLTRSGNLSYDAQSGSYKGTVPVDVDTHPYNVKVRFENTLVKRIAAVITKGQNNNLPATKLINGDVNGDNELNLKDYTLLISCLNGKSCQFQMSSDLNLDGKVDVKDLNILYSQFTNRQGE